MYEKILFHYFTNLCPNVSYTYAQRSATLNCLAFKAFCYPFTVNLSKSNKLRKSLSAKLFIQAVVPRIYYLNSYKSAK